MKIARFQYNGHTAHGVVEGDEVVEIEGDIFSEFQTNGERRKLADVQLLAPTDPKEIWAPGLNFANHLEFAAGVLGDEDPHIPERPEPWIKARNSLAATGESIVLPHDTSGEVHYEGEAVAVIGKTCRRVSPQEAGSYILGYTCGNDVSERAWQKDDWTFWRAKGSDTFAPVGPWIDTGVNPQALEMIVRLNGEEVQHGRTEEMLVHFRRNRQLHQPANHAATGRPGIFRLHRRNHRAEGRRPGRGGDTGHRRAVQPRGTGKGINGFNTERMENAENQRKTSVDSVRSVFISSRYRLTTARARATGSPRSFSTPTAHSTRRSPSAVRLSTTRPGKADGVVGPDGLQLLHVQAAAFGVQAFGRKALTQEFDDVGCKGLLGQDFRDFDFLNFVHFASLAVQGGVTADGLLRFPLDEDRQSVAHGDGLEIDGLRPQPGHTPLSIIGWTFQGAGYHRALPLTTAAGNAPPVGVTCFAVSNAQIE